jgi:hypothetical protein
LVVPKAVLIALKIFDCSEVRAINVPGVVTDSLPTDKYYAKKFHLKDLGPILPIGTSIVVFSPGDVVPDAVWDFFSNSAERRLINHCL